MYEINNKAYLKTKRLELRKHLTPAEAKLWKELQHQKLGTKFRRQHSVQNYILDFYSPTIKLAIELDGSPHDTETGYAKDQTRDLELNKLGIKTLRFQNKDVYTNLEGVILEIKKYINN